MKNISEAAIMAAFFMTNIKYFQYMKNSQQYSEQRLRKILGDNVYTSA